MSLKALVKEKGLVPQTEAASSEVWLQRFADAFPVDANRAADVMSLEEAKAALAAAGWRP